MDLIIFSHYVHKLIKRSRVVNLFDAPPWNSKIPQKSKFAPCLVKAYIVTN